MSVCAGNSEDHCCWVNGKVCPHLEENTVEGRHWACGLLVKLGSWEAVYKDNNWQLDVKPLCDRIGVRGCGDWPPKGKTCLECGVSGDG